ncbi:MAG: T9SS type A sorting domain-containing protein [Flavobacterium sp.]|uniref:putative Ig domain-containing protein n=1 Tax=Flavobacterium sp. TaxID=239 RepID=UPI0011FE2146|nr:putative Ig domain-containing protein [Flavobacterium sp.]RZJ67917.1 MAG: T9SS type A sorting domain-containing protein [Flavobacterium sp.]
MKKITFWLLASALFTFVSPAFSQVVINEIVTSNTTLNTDEDGDYQDWVELYNNGPSAVNLNGYGLTDDPTLPFKWVFPNVNLGSGQYLLIYCSDKNRTVVGQPLHTNWKISSSGETITLTNAEAVTVNQVPSTVIMQNFSFGRFPNGTGPFMFFQDVTPSAMNAAVGYTGLLSAPVFSQQGGFSTSAFDLTLSTNEPGATILYTLDGSEPSEANIGGQTYTYRNSYNETGSQTPGPMLTNSYETLTYNTPINIVDRSPLPNKLAAISSTYHFDPSFYIPDNPLFKGTVVRSKVVKPGALASPTISQTYFVTPEGTSRFELPVVSLSFTETSFYDYEDGIFVAGKDFEDWRAENPGIHPGSLRVGNYYRSGETTEQKANMSYYVNGNQVISQDVGIRVRGASTRKYENKSLTIYARSEFGDENLSYPFFSDLPYQDYERLTLSTSGSDFRNTMFRDALCHNICYEMQCENEDYQPTITFINGEYWGIMNLRERYDNNYFKQVYGFEDVDLLENDGDVEEGDDDHYDALSAYMQSHNLSNQADFDYVVTQLDPESFADYYIANIYFDNSDWPGNNQQFWRKKTAQYEPTASYGADGRWRWVFHDMDDTFSFGTDDYNHNNLQIATSVGSENINPAWSTLWLRRMIQNEGFKNYFVNRFADMMNSYYLPAVVTGKMNAMKDVIFPELPEHTQRWSAFDMGDFDWYMNYQTGFANQRPGFQRNHIRNKFSIANNITATLNVSNVDHGYIKINTIEITPALAGVNATPFPWSGTYFSNIPVTLTAIAKPGYVFSHWTGASSATTAEITVTSATSFNVNAVFIPEGFAVEESEPVYFWMMNTAIPNDTPLTFLNSSYEVLPNTTISYSSSLAGYPFTSTDPLWRHGSMERRNSPTPLNYRTEANSNLPYAPGIMRGLQITQPFQNNGLENTMVFNLPTKGYKEIKFSFAAMDEGAATGITLDYSVNAGTPVWITTGLASSSLALTTGTYQLFETDFSALASVNDNENFKVRLRFTGPNMTADTGARVTFNNIAMDGVQMPLTYTSPNTFTVGTVIAPLVPATTATATSYSISTPLPAGLSFDTTTGIISGTPTTTAATATYTVTATNAGGSTTFDVIITVNPAIVAPTALSYTTPNTFTVGTAITALSPTVTGTVDSYSVSATLPAGLSFDTATGVISGTPTAVSAIATYTVTATNSGGSVTFDVEITVNAAAPTALSYSTPNTFTVGTAIMALSPTVTGTVDSYSVSATLPAGLSFDTTTGVILGTPTAVSATATYTVTATNSGGSTTFDVEITVNAAAPTALSYTTPNTFTVGTAITALSPTITGTVDSYSVSPTLPAGLSFDTTTGVISGTPTAVSATATYTVTATNSGGSVTFDVEITVNAAAPTALSYSTPNTFTVGTAITALSPTVTGTVDSYSVSATLPAGLSFDTTTGIISGTPTAVTATTTYTVTATNSGGSVTFDVEITVNAAAPTALSYSTPNTFTVGTAITALSPTITGTVDSYSVSSALPAGLSFDTTTGVISGTPTAVSATAIYTVTATNSGGSVTFDVEITVNAAAPTALSYSTPNTFTVGTAITALSPTITGTVDSYSVSATLPAGLSFDTTTGIISGTPTAVSATATYTVTATNSGGSTTFDVEITVNAAAPTALSYTTPNTFTVGTAITALSPTITGTVDSYGVSATLPAGLSFDTTTGVISGTPTAVSATATYTVTATNSGGSVTFDVEITVNAAAPTALSYTTPNTFTVGTAITALSPTVTGTVDSYSISPTLPAGLSFDTTTGVISGTPTAVSATATYTVTATNSGGSVSFGVVVTVNMAAPTALSYSSPNTFTVGTTITALTPTVTGTVTSYSVVPALPNGLSINTTTGVISGTPASATATSTYTVTATNATGSTSFGVVITVNAAAPGNLSYTTPNVYTIGANVFLFPSIIGSITGFSVSPALPDGLTLNPLFGIITGNPTTVTPTAIYTVTATNSGGSTSFGISITINDIAPSALSYTSPNTFAVGNAIAQLTPSVTGNVVSYSVSPGLPAGLSLNTTTGVISGTPSAATATATYTVTATNSGGSTSFGVVITVTAPAPSALSYTTPNVFTAGTTITALTPTVTGSVSSYSVSPSLPAGLSLNTSTGVISGTPSVATALASYTVTATNLGGSTTFDVVITVNAAAPTALSYNSPNTFTVGNTITNLNPTVTGTVSSYSVSPALPAGLSLNAATGVISGTPSAVAATATYTVTATNVSGNASFGVVITVNPMAPDALSYNSPNTFTVGTAIGNLNPTVFGTVTLYSVSPALPAGLNLNTTTGVISGTPTAVTATATYTVTATNSGGSVSFGVIITVNGIAPSALSYTSPNTYPVGSNIIPLTPTITGSDVVYSVSPSLPAGLSMDFITGIISGVPTTVTPIAAYTVTATNSGGSISFDVIITITPAAPTALSYTSPNTFTVGTAIANLNPTVTGTVTSYSVSPALPAGLSLNTTTGVISGTPTAVTATATYTVTATNSGGSVSFDVIITVNDIAPTALSYTSPNTYSANAAITPLIPTVTGSGITYSVSPSLPAGLSIDPATGIISGTPTTTTPIATYTVTATNSGGSVSFDVIITITPELSVGDPRAMQFIVFPNPFRDSISIKGLEGDTTYSLYSIDGKLVQSGRVENETIRFGELAQGIYTLRLESEGRMGIKKIVRN